MDKKYLIQLSNLNYLNEYKNRFTHTSNKHEAKLYTQRNIKIIFFTSRQTLNVYEAKELENNSMGINIMIKLKLKIINIIEIK